MTRRKSTWGFGTFDISTASKRREAKAQRALDRARKRQQAADQKRINQSIRLEQRRRKRQEAQWRRADQRRRRAEDKRIKAERRRWEKQQKRQTLGGGWGSGRPRGESATARRAAHNLLTLANSIGVRFTRDDTNQLLAYADQELAASGADLATVYAQLARMTYIGRSVLGVIGQYDAEDVQETDAPDDAAGVAERVLGRVMLAGELIGKWEATKSVEGSMALGLGITQILGATPEAIKADQRAIEAEAVNDDRTAVVARYTGQNKLWTAVQVWLHPEDRPENVRAGTLAKLDAEARAEFRTEAVLAGGDSASEENATGIVGWIRSRLGL